MRTNTAPASIFSTGINGYLQSQASPGPVVAKDESNLDACACLLARVDFKWLMAGQGWWIDPHRFEHDRLYAAEVLRFALASPSLVLRACAASLQIQLGDLVSH